MIKRQQVLGYTVVAWWRAERSVLVAFTSNASSSYLSSETTDY